jgi:flavin-dependent dehydrogenase
MGAIGISRYKLDHALSKLAIQHGATILEQTTVKDISTKDNHTLIHIEGNDIMASMVVLSYGKLSILEKKIKKIEKKANEYVGVKYHVRGNFPIDSIALHNFEGGYCGMSAIEDGKYCVCYLADARLLKKYKGDIQSLEREILWQNPLLQKIFTESEFLFKVPVTISNIEFKVKNPVYRDMLFLGDAAGSIAPLSGNGMSMALHAAKLAYREIKKYVDGNQHHDEMLKNYERQWRKNFYWRVKIGSILQQIIGNTNATHWALKVLKPFPWLVNRIVKATHGKQF